jgi:hypothetical protein
MAITKSRWIILPTLKTNAPKSHPMMRITAITYNKSFIIVMFEMDTFQSSRQAPGAAVYILKNQMPALAGVKS